MNLANQVRTLIHENFLFREGVATLQPDDSLIDSGVLDSAGVLTLVVLLEETFGITVSDDEVTPENLDSLARLTAYVAGKVGHAAERTCHAG